MTSLDRFLDTLIALVKPNSFRARYVLGTGILMRTFIKTRRRINSRTLPTSGFKESLISHGQKGQMYRHLYFHLACYLLGPLGMMLSWGIGLIDVKQAASGRKESETEIRDNLAGRECGVVLTQFFKGRLDEEDVRARLRSILAEQP